MPTFRAALKTISSLSTITKTQTPSLRTYHTLTKMEMCRIDHRNAVKKLSITSMLPLPVLSKMPRMRSLCLTTKSSSTTQRKKSFQLILLASATFIANSSRLTKRLTILHCNMCTRPSSLTRKSLSQSIITKWISCRNATKSSRDSPISNQP